LRRGRGAVAADLRPVRSCRWGPDSPRGSWIRPSNGWRSARDAAPWRSGPWRTTAAGDAPGEHQPDVLQRTWSDDGRFVAVKRIMTRTSMADPEVWDLAVRAAYSDSRRPPERQGLSPAPAALSDLRWRRTNCDLEPGSGHGGGATLSADIDADDAGPFARWKRLAILHERGEGWWSPFTTPRPWSCWWPANCRFGDDDRLAPDGTWLAATDLRGTASARTRRSGSHSDGTGRKRRCGLRPIGRLLVTGGWERSRSVGTCDAARFVIELIATSCRSVPTDAGPAHFRRRAVALLRKTCPAAFRGGPGSRLRFATFARWPVAGGFGRRTTWRVGPRDRGPGARERGCRSQSLLGARWI
jgi:hypothetical protein